MNKKTFELLSTEHQKGSKKWTEEETNDLKECIEAGLTSAKAIKKILFLSLSIPYFV